MADGELPEGVLMTNIAKAIDRLREERRDAQHQVQKLGEAISVLERLTRGANSTIHAVPTHRTISLAQKARWAKIRQMKKAA
ncbi:MAG: hypothetical protein ABR908_04875 [Terriglobales bacterium]